MLNAGLMLLKAGALALYGTTVATLVLPALAEFREPFLYVTGFLAIAHLGEYLWVKSRLAEADPAGNGHFIKTLLFGFLHWLPILRAVNTVKQ